MADEFPDPTVVRSIATVVSDESDFRLVSRAVEQGVPVLVVVPGMRDQQMRGKLLRDLLDHLDSEPCSYSHLQGTSLARVEGRRNRRSRLPGSDGFMVFPDQLAEPSVRVLDIDERTVLAHFHTFSGAVRSAEPEELGE